MSLILDQIDKASRRLDFDIADRIQSLQSKTPSDVTTPDEQAERLKFLSNSLTDEDLAKYTLERILAGNELQPVSYLQRGAIAARPVARIQIRQPNGTRYGWGTGFLIAPRVLLTNNHVLPDKDWAARSEAHFDYELDVNDEPIGPTVFRLEPQGLFHTSKELDFTVVAVAPRTEDGQHDLSAFGWLPLLDFLGKTITGEWLTIIQHPAGERKQLCVRENRLLKRSENVLWYSTDTLGGSSGSPVYNNDWFVVALHHSGVPEKHNDRIQTIDGRDFDPRTMDESQIKWIANEGIRASCISRNLKQFFPSHPLLQPLFSATPETARIVGQAFRKISKGDSALPTLSRERKDSAMSQTSDQTLSIPLQITLRISAPEGVSLAAAQVVGAVPVGESIELPAARGRQPSPSIGRPASFDAPFDSEYKNRKGFDPDFLGGAHRVGFPVMNDALRAEATRLLAPQDSNDHILHYHNFSVVMHKKRRFAIYSAANVSFANRFEMGRPRDVWRLDPRIPIDAQVGEFYYARNKFDRGHLTRREDLEYGATPSNALASAGDTCHFTNCTPQQEKFNQGKQIWQGIERHILESAIFVGQCNAQIMTGPIFDDSDPEYKQIRYPLQYWKVVAALSSQSKLFATAYLASQADLITQFGIEAAPEELLGPFKHFQVKISEIERLTGLSFVCGAKDDISLRDFDPLETAPPRRRRRPFTAGESTAVEFLPPGYIELMELDDIVTA
jgi:endonuclease G